MRLLAATLVTMFLTMVLACGGGAPAPQNNAANPAAVEPALPAEEPKVGTEMDAIRFAKDYVKSQLEYPNDAKFPWADYVTDYSQSGQHWVVRSTVEAKNGFGAYHTLNWKVVLKLEGNTWKWSEIYVGDKMLLSEETKARMEQATEELEKTVAETKRKAKEEERLATEKRQQEEAEAERQRLEAERTANRPKVAASKLTLAKQLIKKGEKDVAKKRLQELITEYPETEAAKEAQTLLDSLK